MEYLTKVSSKGVRRSRKERCPRKGKHLARRQIQEMDGRIKTRRKTSGGSRSQESTRCSHDGVCRLQITVLELDAHTLLRSIPNVGPRGYWTHPHRDPEVGAHKPRDLDGYAQTASHEHGCQEHHGRYVQFGHCRYAGDVGDEIRNIESYHARLVRLGHLLISHLQRLISLWSVAIEDFKRFYSLMSTGVLISYRSLKLH